MSSFMKSLFLAEIDEDTVFPYPQASDEEADDVNRLTHGLARFASKHVNSAAIDREATIPADVIEGLRLQGLFGLLVPRAYGGRGYSASAYVRVIQELAGIDLSLAMMVGGHESLSVTSLLLFATGAQREKYLPKLATGETLGGFALTEAGAGSDAGGLETQADRVASGYVLHGEKTWVTNGDRADLFTVFARTSPPDPGVKPRLTAFLVERAFGARTGASHPKLGVRGLPTTSLSLDHVLVPDANVLGDLGRGFHVAMATLNAGRLGLAASSVGLAKTLVRLATERCQERRAFGRPIGQFALVKDKIAIMLAETFALESMLYMTTAIAASPGTDYSIESAICKVFGSETLVRVANETAQIAAAAGYAKNSPFERLLRDARVNLVYEGTNEILRCFIALSGMAGPGQALAEVSRALREPIKGFGLLSDFALRKARSAFGRQALTRVDPLLRREAAVFDHYAAELGRAVEKVLRKHGENIAEMQYSQRRIADIAVDLFAIVCVLSRTTAMLAKRGEEGARRELDLTAMFVADAARRLGANMASFDANDDELRKAIADRAYVDGGYPF